MDRYELRRQDYGPSKDQVDLQAAATAYLLRASVAHIAEIVAARA